MKAGYATLAERYNTAKKQLDGVEAQIADKKSRKSVAEKFLADLSAWDGFLDEFETEAWTAWVDYATVGSDGTVVVTFETGIDIEAKDPA